MKNLLLLTLLIFLGACAISSKDKKTIIYQVEDKQHIGYLKSGAKNGEKKPAVIIVHEWWGHNDYTRKRADMLAELGYVAFALDMYGEGKQASHPEDAMKFATETMSNVEMLNKKFNAALDILKKRDDVDTSKIAAIGYCFGGGVVLEMARNGADLNLVASFHGSLKPKTSAKKGKTKSKVLVFNGAADPMVTKEDISKFKKEMSKAKVKYSFYNYEKALHAFTNKKADEFGKKFNLPLAYNQEADEDSWKIFTMELAKL